MQTTAVRFKKLHPDAALPRYQTRHAAGMDLVARLDAPITIAPIWAGGSIELITTGLAMALEAGFEAQVRPRSGLATKHGLTLPNAPGTVDSDYRGELMVPLINLGPEPFEITTGLRVAQMIISPVAHGTLVEVAELDDTDRGTGGFGSTGRT